MRIKLTKKFSKNIKRNKQTIELNKMEKYSSLLCFTFLLLFSFTHGQDEKNGGKNQQ